jgi:hypothetical protein
VMTEVRYWVRVYYDTDVNVLDVSFMEYKRRKERHFIDAVKNIEHVGVSIERWCKYGDLRLEEDI